MARTDLTVHIESAPARVWEVLVDWEGQAGWMPDVRSCTVLTRQREGLGVRVRCRTNIAAGIVVTDDLEVTGWEPERQLAIRHLGMLIRGVAAFELSPTAHGTLVEWWEEFEVPLGSLGDALAGVVLVPAVERVFRHSLAGLKRRCERRSVRPVTQQA